MKLWLLRPRLEFVDADGWEIEPKKNNPWRPWYDKCFGMVVRAQDEIAARTVAEFNASAEEHYKPWSNSKLSTCVELKEMGNEELIMKDVHHA